MTFKQLQTKYPEFCYRSFDWGLIGAGLRLSFEFTLGKKFVFRPSVLIKGIKKGELAKLNPGQLDALVFNLGLIEMLSYWKLSCAKRIRIEAGRLSKLQQNWWLALISQGFMQFFYENRLNFNKILTELHFEFGPPAVKHEPFNFSQKEERLPTKGNLLLMSGGKDSLVAWRELNKHGRARLGLLTLNPSEFQRQILRKLTATQKISVERKLDPLLLKLNRQGFLNGHTPFSAYLAFLAVLVATIKGYKRVIVANEQSAEQPNVYYLGQPVNHQWSKTKQFEQMFNRYCHKFLTSQI